MAAAALALAISWSPFAVRGSSETDHPPQYRAFNRFAESVSPAWGILSRQPSAGLPHFLRLHVTSLAIDPDGIAEFARRGGGILPAVPLDSMTDLDLELHPRSPWASGAIIDCAGPHAARRVPPRFLGSNGDFFLSGSVVGLPGSMAFLASTKAGVFGFVEAGEDRWIISSGPCGAGLPTVAYRVSELPPGLIESPAWLSEAPDTGRAAEAPLGEGGVADVGCKQLRIAIDTDHALFALFHGDLGALEGYVGTVAAALDTILSRDMSVQVSVTHLRVFTEDADPWPDTSLNAQLAALYGEWVPKLDSIPRDAVQLLCATPLGGGIAYLDGVCSGYAYSVVGNITGYFPTPLLNNVQQNWDIFASAHELGHNLTVPHTHGMSPPADGCGSIPQDCSAAVSDAGTLMSYCHLCPGGLGNIRLEFHPQSVAVALDHLESVSCDYSGSTLPPTAVADTARALSGSPASIDVLANEWDGNCDAVAIASFDATSVRGGTIVRSVGTGPGGRDELVYSPPGSGWSGLDGFAYTISEPSGQTASAQVVVDVLDPRVPENPIGTVAGLAVSYYALANETLLPDYSQMIPYAGSVSSHIDFPVTVGVFAASGRGDHVGARFAGWITVPESGAWEFLVTSDEGARISLGSRVVVNHDGLHGFSTRMGVVALDAGTHAITVDYFERTGSAGLRLSWRSPDGIIATVPLSAFSSGGRETPADINNDSRVDAADVSAILSAWATANAAADVNDDGIVGPQDLALVLFEWTG